MSRQVMPEAERLRKLAEWFRGFAAVGNSADRQSRTEWATVLDRMADDEERRATAESKDEIG